MHNIIIQPLYAWKTREGGALRVWSNMIVQSTVALAAKHYSDSAYQHMTGPTIHSMRCRKHSFCLLPSHSKKNRSFFQCSCRIDQCRCVTIAGSEGADKGGKIKAESDAVTDQNPLKSSRLQSRAETERDRADRHQRKQTPYVQVCVSLSV